MTKQQEFALAQLCLASAQMSAALCELRRYKQSISRKDIPNWVTQRIRRLTAAIRRNADHIINTRNRENALNSINFETNTIVSLGTYAGRGQVQGDVHPSFWLPLS